MTVQELIDKQIFGVVNLGDSLDRQITVPFCCDLLSIAMGRAPAGCAWVTVMANMNTLAVAALTDTACVILDRKSTRLNSSHMSESRMPSSA